MHLHPILVSNVTGWSALPEFLFSNSVEGHWSVGQHNRRLLSLGFRKTKFILLSVKDFRVRNKRNATFIIFDIF